MTTFVTYHMSTGGTALPIARYFLASEPMNIKSSGKDWILAASRGVNLLYLPLEKSTGSTLFKLALARWALIVLQGSLIF